MGEDGADGNGIGDEGDDAHRSTTRRAEEREDIIELWVADITYIPTWAGFLYLAVVLDAWSRRVVCWAMATHLRTELVLDALNMALWQRRPEAVIHHSDQGSQPRFKGSSQQHRVEGGFLRPRFHWTIDWRGRRGPDRGSS